MNDSILLAKIMHITFLKVSLTFSQTDFTEFSKLHQPRKPATYVPISGGSQQI